MRFEKRPWVWGTQRTRTTPMIAASAEQLGRSPNAPWQVRIDRDHGFSLGRKGRTVLVGGKEGRSFRTKTIDGRYQRKMGAMSWRKKA